VVPRKVEERSGKCEQETLLGRESKAGASVIRVPLLSSPAEFSVPMNLFLLFECSSNQNHVASFDARDDVTRVRDVGSR
jgi:hypothetical protein